MAIDTRDKRRASIRMPFASPAGGLAAADRMQVTWNYPVSAIADIPPSVEGLEATMPEHRLHATMPKD